MTMGISNNTTVNIFEPLPIIDFTLDDLQEETKPFSDDFSLYDFSPLCIPNDSLDDIGWLLPSLPDFSNSLKTTDSKPSLDLSFLDFPTTPEQEIEFINSNKRSLPKDFHHQHQHQHVSSLKKKLRSKRSSCGRVWSVNAKALLPAKRRCTHCGTEETPQWRMGPTGPKTLCNACGVRYNKSGRLVPEYRPAASPTFNTQLHSNSYRKIVKMRMTKDM